MFLKLDKNKVKEKQAVYIFKFYLDYNNRDVVYKIGMTTREEVAHRLAEVLLSFFLVFRYTPRCSVLRFSTCEDALGKEKALHSMFIDNSVEFLNKFSGSTEFFYIDDEEYLLEQYDKLVKGK